MGNFETNGAASQAHLAEQQLAIVTRLWGTVASMNHIDDVLQWLVTQIAQRFHVQAAEIWALQVDATGQQTLQLRTLTIADQSLPEHVIANQHIAVFAARMCSEQRNYPVQSVKQLFSGYPASTLTRYGLNYVTGYYFHGPVALLPPARHAAAGVSGPGPFTLAMLLFQQEKRPGDLLSALQFILPQVVLAAKNHNLLPVAPTETPGPATMLNRQGPSTPGPQQRAQLNLWLLIPRRHQEADLLMSSNPLSRSVDIPDKQARRLYGAIDGKKNIGELSRAIGMDAQEMARALQNLIAQRRINLYEPGGKLINPSHFMP